MELDFMQLRQAEHIWIYGAGMVGKRVLKLLSEETFHLRIEGFVVSELSEEQKQPDGCRIVKITDTEVLEKDSVFIVAVSSKYQKEIVDTLSAAGYSHYIIWENEFVRQRWYLADYRLEDRRRKLSKACFVLSGYKEFLWDIVFGRLKQFVPEDVDVCILSSGMYSERLSRIARENGWSYLSTELNDVTLVQNIAIRLFEDADWIYKMDEDIFVTHGSFETLMRTYVEMEHEGPYQVCFTAPLIPVNGYGYIRILERLGKREIYEERFEKVVYGCHPESMLEKDINAAGFMWGAGGDIPQLDSLNDMFSKDREYSVCGVRFSIGFILFHRSTWETMKGFSVSGKLDLGVDEVELCQHCMVQSKAIIIAENTVVGHFSFKQQAEKMREFYEKNQGLFQIGEKL